jgi:hypothetical protein
MMDRKYHPTAGDGGYGVHSICEDCSSVIVGANSREFIYPFENITIYIFPNKQPQIAISAMDYRDTNIFVALEHLTPLCLSFLFIYFEEMYQDV